MEGVRIGTVDVMCERDGHSWCYHVDEWVATCVLYD